MTRFLWTWLKILLLGGLLIVGSMAAVTAFTLLYLAYGLIITVIVAVVTFLLLLTIVAAAQEVQERYVDSRDRYLKPLSERIQRSREVAFGEDAGDRSNVRQRIPSRSATRSPRR